MGLRRYINMFKNLENWDEYLAYKYGGKKKPHFVFRLRNGYSITISRKIMHEFKESLFEEVYFKYLPKNIYNKPNPVLLDIGANVGYFTILALYKLNNPSIICFEPVSRNFSHLENNLQKIKNENVTLVNKAVSDTKGELVLKFDDSDDITTSASLFENPSGNHEEIVSTTTLQDIFTDYKLLQVDVLKLDCEGAEYNIIYRTPRHIFENIHSISLETHVGFAENENKNALTEYMKGLGYKVILKRDLIWAYRYQK